MSNLECTLEFETLNRLLDVESGMWNTSWTRKSVIWNLHATWLAEHFRSSNLERLGIPGIWEVNVDALACLKLGGVERVC